MRGLQLLGKLFEGERLRGGLQGGSSFTELVSAQQYINENKNAFFIRFLSASPCGSPVQDQDRPATLRGPSP
jgi:hypothetical protein